MSMLIKTAHAVTLTPTINPNLPGSSGTSPANFVVNLYNLSLMIGGLLAFGAIVWGGIQYTWAAGNPSAQEEGKHWIEGAFYGLLLLAGAYVVLHTINPDILNFNLPGIINKGQ